MAFATKAVQRDPDRPKRPVSPYLHFVADFRKKHVDLKGAEVLKKAGEEWKAMTPEAKRPFVEPFEKEQQAYKEKYDAYVASGKKAAWTRDPEMPKRPLTGFMRYVSEFRTKHPDLKMTEQSKAAGEAWKKMTPEQQKPYTDKYATEKKEYDAAYKAYCDSGKKAAWEKKVGITDLKAKQEKAKAKKAAELEKAKAKKAAELEKAKTAADKAKAKLAAVKAKAKEDAVKAKTKAQEAKAKLAADKAKAK